MANDAQKTIPVTISIAGKEEAIGKLRQAVLRNDAGGIAESLTALLDAPAGN